MYSVVCTYSLALCLYKEPVPPFLRGSVVTVASRLAPGKGWLDTKIFIPVSSDLGRVFLGLGGVVGVKSGVYRHV